MSVFDESTSCCDSDDSAKVRRAGNRPGLAEFAYRLADHASFKAAMLDTLGKRAELRGLRTRSDDDPSIALVDAWAAVLDVLTFYQERIANEGFLGTARERRSVLELARAIGYELNPGVSAATYLAFTLEKIPAGPETQQLDKGLKVQSVPGKDELPQMFETEEALTGNVKLNRLRPRLTRPQNLGRASTTVYLQGLNTGLQPGDLLLLVGKSRENSPYSERWDVRTVTTVETHPAQNFTRVSWRVDLGHSQPSTDPADEPRIFKFTRRASLFGYNAPDWRAMPDTIRREFDDNTPNRLEWPDYENRTIADNRIDLDTVYDDILVGDWVLLDKPSYRELFRATRVFTDSRRDYTLTGKVTSVILDSRNHLNYFSLRNTSVFSASRELMRVAEPILQPVFGERVVLEGDYPDLEDGRVMIVQGEPVKTVVVGKRRSTHRTGRTETEVVEGDLMLSPLASSAAPVALASGDELSVNDVPQLLANGLTRWFVSNAEGLAGTIDVDGDDLLFPYQPKSANTFEWPDQERLTSQVVTIRRLESEDGLTVVVLNAPLTTVYYRESVVILANVAYATHGESRSEAMAVLTGFDGGESIGSGNAGSSMQQFKLLQTPLTYVPAQTPTGGRSSVTVAVDGLSWTQVPTLFGQKREARVFSVRHQEDGQAYLQFGDGEQGARLPTGQNNIVARYRTGLGEAGNLRAGQLSLLATRPLGVREVVNPLVAAGGQNPEAIDEARRNAPLTVLTLDRLVSVQDYEDFTSAFAGIGKAQATVLWNGESQLIHLTVAGIGGLPLDPDMPPLKNLRGAMDSQRHSDQHILIAEYQPELFTLFARIIVANDRDPAAVLKNVEAQLKSHYQFANRQFAEPVRASQLIAFIQGISGVAAVVLEQLDGRSPLRFPYRTAERARWNASGQQILPAQLLTVNPDGIRLEVMEP